MSASSIDAIVHGHPMYINIAVHYVRPKQITYARESFQAIIREVVDSDDLDLEADPSMVCTHSCPISTQANLFLGRFTGQGLISRK
jgi:hypothetical protein